MASKKGKLLLFIGLLSLVTLANLPKAIADDNAATIKIPNGEEKTLWDLGTDPFTRYIGGVFHLIWIMSIAGLAWMRSDSLGLPLIWITVASAALAGLPIPGAGTVFFALVAVFAVTIGVVRLIVKRRTR
jgi:hypothetical protein